MWGSTDAGDGGAATVLGSCVSPDPSLPGRRPASTPATPAASAAAASPPSPPPDLSPPTPASSAPPAARGGVRRSWGMIRCSGLRPARRSKAGRAAGRDSSASLRPRAHSKCSSGAVLGADGFLGVAAVAAVAGRRAAMSGSTVSASKSASSSPGGAAPRPASPPTPTPLGGGVLPLWIVQKQAAARAVSDRMASKTARCRSGELVGRWNTAEPDKRRCVAALRSSSALIVHCTARAH